MELLHSGWSVVEKRWMDRKPDVGVTFFRKQFYLFTESEDADADALSKSFWKLVLIRAGASIADGKVRNLFRRIVNACILHFKKNCSFGFKNWLLLQKKPNL